MKFEPMPVKAPYRMSAAVQTAGNEKTTPGTGIDSAGSGAFETCSEVPEDLGRGTRRVIRLFSGIYLCIANCRYHENFKTELDNTLPCLGFGFCLSGRTNVRQDCLRHELVITGNRSAFYYFPDMKGTCEVKSGREVLTVGIRMDPDLFRSLMEEERHYGSAKLRKLIENNRWETFRHENAVTPSMKRIVTQIANCPYTGLTRRFFYEARAMELIFHKLMQLEPVKTGKKELPRFSSADAERIYLAGELLAKNLEKPPGLDELSRSVGMSRTRLLRDFPKVFGTSPYKYLRDLRLKKAGTLFTESGINITEAAQMVGYSSASHFTKAFKQCYGMTPSCYLRELNL